MTLINESTIKTLRAEFQAALDAVAAKHGLSAGMGRITYDHTQTNFRCKLEVVTKTKIVKEVVTGDVAQAVETDGDFDPTWAANFKRYAGMLGMTPNDLGKEVTVHGKKFIIAGYRPKARNKMVLRRPTGGHVAYDERTVCAAFNIQSMTTR